MLCEQIPNLEVVKAFNSPLTLLKEQEDLDYDLLITDIEMPGMNGLQVADVIKNKAIIFTTAYKNFAVDAFDRDAVDYVVKPIRPERLAHAIEKVAAIMAKPKPTLPTQIQLNTDRGKALITADTIFCIVTSKIDSRDKIIILDNDINIIAKNASFEKLMDMLPKNDFCRINKKAIIALKHVQFYAHDIITADKFLPDGSHYTFPLSEIYRTEFIRKVKI